MVSWVLGIQFVKKIIYPSFRRQIFYKKFYIDTVITSCYYSFLVYVFFIIMLYTTVVIRLSLRTRNFQKYMLCNWAIISLAS